MVLFVRHRVNSVSEIESVPRECGVEIDLRSDVSSAGAIHLSHDPFKRGEDFEAWLDAFKARGIAGPIILNTKEDLLEARAVELLSARGLTNWFFLDTALPTLVKWTIFGAEKRFAVRLSAYEPFEGLAAFRGRVEWVWVDCFEGRALPTEVVKRAKVHFKVCLVSPELQGKGFEGLGQFAELYALADAVCTKKPEEWRARFQ